MDNQLDPEAIPLPPGFSEISEKWIIAAKELVKSYPNIPDFEYQTQVVRALGEIVYTIDEAVESLDPNDPLLPRVGILLLSQSFALQYRCLLLRDPHSFSRAVYILEMLPQLFDPAAAELLQIISGSLDDFLAVAAKHLLDRRRSDFVSTRLLESAGTPSDFMMRTKSIVEQANDISHIPAELSNCSPQSPLIHDLDWVTTTVNGVLEHSDSSDQQREVIARLLVIKVVALQARFRLLGDANDLDRSAFVSQVASLFHSSVADLPYSDLHKFAFPPREPFDYLDANIAIAEELLRHPREETRVSILTKLALLLLRRCTTRKDNIADGEHVLQLCEDTLPIVPRENRSEWLALRTGALLHLSAVGRQFPDLEQTLELLDEGVGFVEKAQEQRSKAFFFWYQLRNAVVSGNEQAAVSAFHEIHARDFTHFEIAITVFRGHSEADILHVIEALKQSCIDRSQEESFKPFAIILVIALWWRHRLSGDTRYLREAVSLRSRLGPPGSYGLDFEIYGGAVTHDFNGAERRPEFAKAIMASSRGFIYQFPEVSGLEATPGQREVVGGHWMRQFHNSLRSEVQKEHDEIALVAMRESAYKKHDDDMGFQISHREFLIQRSASKNDPRQRRDALSSLGSLYALRYERQKDVKDLEQAVDWYQQCVDTLGEDDQTPLTLLLRTTWADKLFQLHEATNSVEYSRLLEAHDSYRQAAASALHIPNLRLHSLSQWMRHTPKLQSKDNMEHVLEIYELALSLLEEQGWAASSPRLSLNARHKMRLLGRVGVKFAFDAGFRAGGLTKAIEFIEASQALIWGHLHRLRTSLGDLKTVSSVLATRFQQLSRRLESRMGLLDADPEEDDDPLGMNNWTLNQEMKRVIEEIRTVPKFGEFLQRRTFREDELRVVTKDGPVVILLDEGKALVLHQDRHTLVDLPITYNALQSLHQSLRPMANARDIPSESGLADGSICTDAQTVAGPSDSTQNLRSLRKTRHDTSMLDLLAALWRDVVEPVLVEILGQETEKGKSTMWKIPKLEDRQRIWWYCLGEFTFLPIHAAGIYTGNSQICLSDFFISSYTPTLTALLDARARPTPPDIKILAAAQPNPGGGWYRLTLVKDELREIIQATPPVHLIFLGDTTQPDFEGRYTTVENILKKLPEASVLHLACHGTQNAFDPLSSGFILANGNKLTIEELMKYRLPNAHTAILSACHSASNDAEQPHEAINLSSALMFLGFSNILGTKWPMNDSDGPVIAKAVYEALFDTTKQPETTICTINPEEVGTDTKVAAAHSERSPTLASLSLARVVDNVTRHLRLEKKVKAERWATFVHVGI